MGGASAAGMPASYLALAVKWDHGLTENTTHTRRMYMNITVNVTDFFSKYRMEEERQT